MTAAPFPDREAVAEKLSNFGDADRAYLLLLMENPVQDDNLLEGLLLWLDMASTAKFLNAMKIGAAGEWLGNTAPQRLQMRLMEAARSSQHAAFQSFREGLVKSGGLERAFPKA
jgi:hypothetical protein